MKPNSYSPKTNSPTSIHQSSTITSLNLNQHPLQPASCALNPTSQPSLLKHRIRVTYPPSLRMGICVTNCPGNDVGAAIVRATPSQLICATPSHEIVLIRGSIYWVGILLKMLWGCFMVQRERRSNTTRAYSTFLHLICCWTLRSLNPRPRSHQIPKIS